MAAGAVKDIPTRPPEVRVVQVIEVGFLRGTGVGVDDPVRKVMAYYDFEGALLAENDICMVPVNHHKREP